MPSYRQGRQDATTVLPGSQTLDNYPTAVRVCRYTRGQEARIETSHNSRLTLKSVGPDELPRCAMRQ